MALELPHMLLVNLEALLKVVLLCSSSFLLVSCMKKSNRGDHLGNQKEFKKLNMILIMLL